MTRAQRLEAGLALAMLPVGATLGLISALGAAMLLILTIPALLFAISGAVSWSLPVWCFGGGAALVWATVGSIKVVSALDWRPLPRVLAAMGLTAAAALLLW